MHNILASFSARPYLTNPPVQYSIYVENRYCTDFVIVPNDDEVSTISVFEETARLAFVACSSLFENLHYLRTEPSHCQDFDHLIVYFNACNCIQD